VSLPRRAFGVVVLLAGAALAGCGGGDEWDRVPATGAVTVPGLAPEQIQGSLILVPADGTDGPSASADIVAGSFAFDRRTGPVPGPHEALIQILAPAETRTASPALPGSKDTALLHDVRLPCEAPSAAPYRMDLVVTP
jgi:hypothetical protein